VLPKPAQTRAVAFDDADGAGAAVLMSGRTAYARLRTGRITPIAFSLAGGLGAGCRTALGQFIASI
jgi:hypothetical protein